MTTEEAVARIRELPEGRCEAALRALLCLAPPGDLDCDRNIGPALAHFRTIAYDARLEAFGVDPHEVALAPPLHPVLTAPPDAETTNDPIRSTLMRLARRPAPVPDATREAAAAVHSGEIVMRFGSTRAGLRVEREDATRPADSGTDQRASK